MLKFRRNRCHVFRGVASGHPDLQRETPSHRHWKQSCWMGTESERIRVRTSTGQNVNGLVETYTSAGENVHGLKAQVQCNVLCFNPHSHFISPKQIIKHTHADNGLPHGQRQATTWTNDAILFPHWGQATHICVGILTSIGSDNGLSPGRRQAIILTKAVIFLTEPLRTDFSDILIRNKAFSFEKMILKMSSAKWCPFCLGLNVLSGPVGINISESVIELSNFSVRKMHLKMCSVKWRIFRIGFNVLRQYMYIPACTYVILG